jgi:hypothetical protein
MIAKLSNEILVQGFCATDGRIEDVSSYRADICGNIATFTILTLIRKVYGFFYPSIQHVCDNKSAINATWKDENISVFYKTKPDADVAKVARLAISDIQQHSQVDTFCVEGHANTHSPPFSPQEAFNILTYTLASKAQTSLHTDMKPHPDCLQFPEKNLDCHSTQKSHLPPPLLHCKCHPWSQVH